MLGFPGLALNLVKETIHETNLAAQKTPPRPRARVSRAHEHAGWTPFAQSSPY
jgi:hypothetical protein